MKEHQEVPKQRRLQYQILQQQIMQLQQQLEFMEQHEAEILIAKQAIEEMSTKAKGTELYVPVTSGIFVKSELKDTGSFLVNIGHNVAVKKDAQATISLLEKQGKEIAAVKDELSQHLESAATKAMLLEADIKEDHV